MFYYDYRFIYYIFFFFQAEDGIRDHCVTGVQTCALPIFHRRDAPRFSPPSALEKRGGPRRIQRPRRRALRVSRSMRSEERRVGKEYRTRLLQCDYKNKI